LLVLLKITDLLLRYKIEFVIIFKLFIFVMFLNSGEVRKLAPIVVVMLPEALVFEAKPQHLNG